MQRLSLSIVCLVLAACGAGSEQPVVIDGVIVTSPAAGMPMAAGFFELENRSGQALRITSVSSPQYESVEMHRTVVTDGVSRMREIPALQVDAGETVVFESGGNHLMLMGPVGDTETVTLNFYSDDALVVSVSTVFTTSSP